MSNVAYQILNTAARKGAGLQRPLILAIVALAVLLFTVISYSWTKGHSLHNLHNRLVRPSTFESEVHNSTLGFQEVFYISMPYRTDRQDAMNLLASMSDVQLKLIPGVRGEDVHEKARPDGSNLKPSALGCWRAHVDTWRHIIENNIQTALILEDDIDWDVNLKQILSKVSNQMKTNTALRLEPESEWEKYSTPYGSDWDLLFLGQCLDLAPPHLRSDLKIIYDDEDVPSLDQTAHNFRQMLRSLNVTGDDIGKKRVITPSWGPACTMGYGVTRRGAQRLLLNLSYLGLRGPVDNDMAWTFQDGKLRGYSVNPPIFNPWRVGGQKDSDNFTPNSDQSIEGSGNKAGSSSNIKNSARKALVNALALNNWADYERTNEVKE
ncbi:hypothetical protein V1514DRAFT_307396 [Lipomyces japonicus]|uniref:uncharacterized protein n=1 Tax=Lipomyces japonicus TaxID=56871 RepID=UPI0034CFC9AD